MTRVLRVPGFANCKYDSKPIVTVVESNFDGARYTLADFHVEVAASIKKAAPLPNIIFDGRRNDTLTSLAGSMRRRGASKDAILAALRVENDTRCQPPLDESELDTIATSIARYEPAVNNAEFSSDDEPPPTSDAKESEVEEVPEFPAITGSIQELVEALAPDIPREFKIMAAVTRIGLALSGKVHLEGEPHFAAGGFIHVSSQCLEPEKPLPQSTKLKSLDSRLSRNSFGGFGSCTGRCLR